MPLPSGSENIIREWFKEHDQKYGPDFIKKAGLYHDLLVEWSSRINLISTDDIDILLERHMLDSLVPIKEIPFRGNLLDIGSGGGFPAIPIALVRPELNITMVESRRKKVLFLNEVIGKLDLKRASVWNGRLEDFSPIEYFDIITIRAVAPVEKIRKKIRKILRESGKIIYYSKFGEYKLL